MSEKIPSQAPSEETGADQAALGEEELESVSGGRIGLPIGPRLPGPIVTIPIEPGPCFPVPEDDLF